MGQSLVKNYTHLVWSTKHRQPFITEDIEDELFSFLADSCKKLECPVLTVGGYKDHVHVLCMLSQKIALMKLMELVKSHSSGWIKTKGEEFKNFYWQNGYAAFSVSPGHVKQLVPYIQDQRAHHEKQTFKEELRGWLKKYEVEYDERYVWD